jgi:hypothetical protein
MLRDSIRAALAAFVLWPLADRPPAPPPAWQPAPPTVWQPAPPTVWQPAPPGPGPVRRAAGAALDVADRLAARWLPPL